MNDARRACDYWKPIPNGGIALPCNCGMRCDGRSPQREDQGNG